MLRKFRLTTHWQYVDSFPEAVRAAGYDLDDNGWMRRGTNPYEERGVTGRDIPEDERVAFVSLIFEDNDQTRAQVVNHIRSTTGIPFLVGQCIVFLPDGLESAWYDMVWPLCTKVQEAEERAYGPEGTATDLEQVLVFREALQPILDQGIAEAEGNLAAFQTGIGEVLGLDLSGKGGMETLSSVLQALREDADLTDLVVPDTIEGLTDER